MRSILTASFLVAIVLAGGRASTLPEQIAAAGSGATIELGMDTAIGGEIVVARELTLVGSGDEQVGLAAKEGASRFFVVADGGVLTLRNLRLTGGNAVGVEGAPGLGGGVFVAEGGRLVLENVSIEYCGAAGGKGHPGGEPGGDGGRGGFVSETLSLPPSAGRGDGGGARGYISFLIESSCEADSCSLAST